jgi:hypothetical protein
MYFPVEYARIAFAGLFDDVLFVCLSRDTLVVRYQEAAIHLTGERRKLSKRERADCACTELIDRGDSYSRCKFTKFHILHHMWHSTFSTMRRSKSQKENDKNSPRTHLWEAPSLINTMTCLMLWIYADVLTQEPSTLHPFE